MDASDAGLGPVIGESLPVSLPPERVRLVLTIEEAAERLGVGRSLMYALVNSGAVESIRIGRLHRVPADALSEFVAELRTPGHHAAPWRLAERGVHGLLGSDGYWHGRVTVGLREDGRPDRRHVMSKSRTKILEKVRQLEKARVSGAIQRVGENWTVEQWLTHWVENIAAPFVRDNTLAGYRVAVNKHLIPGIGAHRLSALRPEHLEALYVRMLKARTKSGTLTRPATVHQVHRTVRAALNEAVRRGYATSNPAKLAKAPRVVEDEVEPFTVEDVQQLLRAASESRNSARWALALALGLRQGEALGLQWSDVDLDAQLLVVRRNRLRPRYAHGCRPPCGRKYAGHCPQRQQIRVDADETKSNAGRRVIGLPDALVRILAEHRVSQARERLHAAQLWVDGGWLFATQVGAPINPRTDWDEWKQLLTTAGIRDGRLHDARHTAATVLLMLGVSERTIMGLMGWSNPAMTRRYAHMVDPIRHETASRIDGLLWAPQDEPGRGAKPGQIEAG